MKKIRILVTGLSKNFGGIESFFVEHLKFNNKEKFQYDFLLYDNVSYENEILSTGSNIIKLSYKRKKNPIKHITELKNFLYNNNVYDYVWHNVMSRSYLAPVKIANKLKIKTIVHSHGAGQYESTIITKILHKFNKKNLFKYADIYFTCSFKAAKFMFEENAEKALLIKNSISVDKFKYNHNYRCLIRDEFNIKETTLLLGSVSRIEKVKNLFFLVDVFKKVTMKNNDAKLLIVGDGPLGEKLKKYCIDLGLNDKVIFTGSRRDVYKILSALDVFVLTSLSEGLGISLIEAQAAGLHSVVSNIIPNEAILTNYVHSMSLSESPDTWSKKILSIENYFRSSDQEIKIKKYDVSLNMDYINGVLFKKLFD